MSLLMQRVRNHLTQNELAQKIGVSQSTVTKWERGVTYPPVRKLIKLSEILNCSFDDLLADEKK